MTKQEILDKYVPCECWPVNDGGKPVYNSSCHQHSPDPESAMDEWAKQESVGFAEWMDELLYNNVLQRARARSSSYYGKWIYSPPYEDDQMLTTEELFTLYLNQKSKQSK